jgi:tetratricopeptide (TPR) repeat protein
MKKLGLFALVIFIIGLTGKTHAQDKLNQGKSLLDQKDCAGAIPYLVAAVKDDPRSLKANLYLGDAYSCVGKLDSAELYYAAAIKIDDESAPAYYGLGHIYLQQGKFADAVKDLNLAINYDPKNENYVIDLGRAYFSANQLDSAMQAFYKARDMNDKDPRALEGIGDVYRKQNIFDPAIENYKAAIALDSSDVSLRVKLANAYMQNNNGVAAYEEFVKISKIAPENADAQREAGELLYINKRYRDAVPFLEKYHQLVPTDDKELLHLADAALNGEEFSDAEKYYREYIAKHPDDLQAKKNLAAAFFFMKKPLDSYNIFRTIPIDSLDVKSLVRYGQAANEVHDTTATIDAWSRAVKIDSNLSVVEYQLANILFAARKYNDAIDHFKRHLAMSPEDAAAELNMGLCYFVIQNYSEAIAALKRFGEMKHANVQATIQGQLWLARAYVFAGNLDSAKEVYQDIIKLCGSDTSGADHSQDLNESYRQIALYQIITGGKISKEHPDDAKRFYTDALQNLMTALKYDPKETKTHALLAQDYALLGKIDDACREIKTVLRTDPRDDQMLKLQKQLGCE